MMISAIALAVATAGATTYPVAMTISRDGRVIATPQMTLTEGRAATIEANRPDGYLLRVLLTRPPDGAADTARIETTVSLKRDDRWVVVATPVVTMRLGGAATFQGNADSGIAISYRIDAPR